MTTRVERWRWKDQVRWTGARQTERSRPGAGATVRVFPGLLLATIALIAPVASVTAQGAQQEPPPVERLVCAECHAVAELRASVHGEASVSCLACHRVDRHRDMPRDSALTARERSAVCAECHDDDVAPSHPLVVDNAPLCTDCHSAHGDPPLERAMPALLARCGACHVEERDEFRAGAHAASAEGDARNADVPTCVTCHAQHDTTSASPVATRLAITALCIECHSDARLVDAYDLPAFASETYRDDFHGATLQLLFDHPGTAASEDVLVCSDCHGAHAVSWLEREEVAPVCLSCHVDADARIVGAWLGHERVSPDNAFFIWAVRIFYYVFIPLVLGGLFINILIELRAHRQRKAHAHAASGFSAGVKVQRFSLFERIQHLFAMTTFTLLVVTGLPQIYPSASVSYWLLELWGGIGPTRTVHRVTGVLFVALLIGHVGYAILNVIRKRRMPIMVAHKKDFADTWQTLRHFLGSAPAPKVGKFDFRAKFEYWGLFLGGTIMSVTGFLLMFPELVSRLVPGGAIAAARVVHGLEATFAVLVVLLWHTWSVILRPEIFPLDKTIFTGKMELDRLREEHALEYERIFGRKADTNENAAD